ncbi:MAG: D-alanine--D-alanine ligase [Planctomycetes bacterium B3_Pla]|nr:MAG: D-alanine--D-alanine ligase [Planctomycetes bacterium B3_Pla]
METVNSKSKVAVLTGGIGAERDVSLQSGRCVADALAEAGFSVVTADIQPDNLDILQDNSIDVFFPALHGEFGEDGQLQQILERKSLLYTGSGPAASKVAFDKMASKKLFDDVGVLTPAAIEFGPETDVRQLEEQLHDLADKYVVKPVKLGSSVGVSIVSAPHEAIAAAQTTFSEFGDCMIEEFVPGREVTVSILCGRALPIIEIRTQSSFYDYHAKYVDDQTQYLFDTVTNQVVAADINRAAIDCFDALGCRHFGRIDFVLSDDRIAYVLEVNTIPGFTTHSLLPKAAAKTGLAMSDLCTEIVEAACSSVARPPA